MLYQLLKQQSAHPGSIVVLFRYSYSFYIFLCQRIGPVLYITFKNTGMQHRTRIYFFNFAPSALMKVLQVLTFHTDH